MSDQDIPEWITKFKSEDAAYKYYLGVSDFVESQAQAVNDALKTLGAKPSKKTSGSRLYIKPI
jgi:hypothetical protein